MILSVINSIFYHGASYTQLYYDVPIIYMQLIVGKHYIIDISLHPKWMEIRNEDISTYNTITNHKFIHNVPVTYLGRDTEYEYGESHRFLSNYILYDNLSNDDDFMVFNQFTNVCISLTDNDKWIFHIFHNRFTIVKEID